MKIIAIPPKHHPKILVNKRKKHELEREKRGRYL